MSIPEGKGEERHRTHSTDLRQGASQGPYDSRQVCYSEPPADQPYIFSTQAVRGGSDRIVRKQNLPWSKNG